VHGREWSELRYLRNLRCHPDPECDAATLLVDFLKEQSGTFLTRQSRPEKDRRREKEPDFLYEDAQADLGVAIEVKSLLLKTRQETASWQRDFAQDIESCLQATVACLILVGECWRPPRSTGKEGKEATEMCRRIASALEREGRRVDAAVPNDPGAARCVKVDLSDILPKDAHPAVAFLRSFGRRRSVNICDWPSAVAYSADAFAELRLEEYRCRLRKANAQLDKYAEAGRETILLLDARVDNELFPDGLHEVREWHRAAADPHSAILRRTPIKQAHFEHIHHVVALEADPYGISVIPVWSRSEPRLAVPDLQGFVPPGWVRNE